MDAAQRRQFAENGYFVVHSCISQQHVARLNELFDSRLQEELGSAAPPPLRPDGAPLVWHGFKKEFPLKLWGQPYYELVDPPQLVPILRELLGDSEHNHGPVLPADERSRQLLRARIRLDHDNIHFTPAFEPGLAVSYPEGATDPARPGQPPRTAAGGPKEYWSPAGLIRGGLHGAELKANSDDNPTRMITCAYELLPVAEGCGGTVFLPGSHRPEVARPPTARTVHHRPPWPKEFGLQTVRLAPGDCLVFSEVTIFHRDFPA